MNNKRIIKIFTIFILYILMFINLSEAQVSNTSKQNNEFRQKKEIINFIPYSELKSLLDKNKKLVYMSYQDLKKLIATKSQYRAPAPIGYVIKDLALIGTVNGNYISFDATYQLEILNKEWTYIPIISTKAGVKSATLDNKPAPISSDTSNFNILSDSVGTHTLKLKFDVKIDESGNTKKFDFTLPNLPITRLTVKIPEQGIRVNIANSSGLRNQFKKNETISYANLNGSSNVSVDWKSNQIKAPQAPVKKIQEKQDNKPSKVVSEVQTLITINEGIMQGFSTFNNQIYHKALDKISVNIPDDIEIVSVDSPNNIVQKGLPDITDPNGKEPGKRLTIYFVSQIKDNAIFTVSFQKTFENKKTEISVPEIQLTGNEINKVIGFIAIQSFGNLEINQLKTTNISSLDPKDLPGTLESSAERPILLAYGYIKNKFNLDLEIIPHNDASVEIAMIDSASVDSRLSTDGILTTNANYTIRNMSEQYFKFKLPKNAEILTANIDSNNIQIEQVKEDKNEDSTYQINIKNYQNETPFHLSFMYKQDLHFNFLNRILGFYRFSVPEVLNLKTLTVSYQLWLPESMLYWFNTVLNKGNNSYGSYITYNSQSDGYSRYDDNVRMNAPAQVANVTSASSEMTVQENKSGIIPPEYNMPPTIGLKEYTFSGYLIGKGNSNVTTFTLANSVILLIFLIMFYIGWKLSQKIHTQIITTKSVQRRAKFAISIALCIYLASIIFGWTVILIPLILSGMLYSFLKVFRKQHQISEV